MRGGNRIGFSLGPYDRSLPLVIDPTLVYSTYLGGSNIAGAALDTGKAIAVDSTGDVYVTGSTGSIDFPVTAGAYESTYPYRLAGFVSKLNPSGSALIYSTYFGNTYPGNITVTGIAVDGSGDAYLTGNTDYDFPTTPGAFQTSETNFNASYAFVTELNPAGTGLVYSTFLGGTETTGSVTTYAYGGIAVDAADNAYVVGDTDSPTYPTTPGAYQTSQNCTFPYFGTCTTGFVTKVSAGGSSLSYSTYLGTGLNKIWAVAVDSSGDAFVVGSGDASTFPVTPGAFQTTSSETAAFVTELNPSGTALVYSTFLSGTTSSTGDAALAVAVDASGYAYVTGQVRDSDFPTTPGAYQRNLLDYADAFVTKLNPTGSALVYSTYLPGLTTGYGIGVDSSGEAYVAGDNYGNAGTFPTTPDAFQVSPPTTTTNGFLTVFNSTGSGLVYSTYIGGPVGNLITDAYGVALDSSGSAYVTGMAQPGFPTTPGAFKTTLTGDANTTNAFIMKFAFAPSAPFAQYSNPGPIDFGAVDVNSSATQQLILTNTGSSPFTINANGISLSGSSAAFSVTNVVCNGAADFPFSSSVSLDGGQSCTITLQFAPTSLGTGQAELLTVATTTTNSNAGAGPGNSGQALLLLGTGGEPYASFSPTQLSFGNVPENTAATQTVAVTNTGTGPLTIQLVLPEIGTGFSDPQFVCSNGASSASSPPYPITLSPADSCTFTVQFDPTTLGPLSGYLQFGDNAGVGESNLTSTVNGSFFTQTVPLTGTGVAPALPYASFSPTQLSFGNVPENTAATQTVAVTNTGTGPLTLDIVWFGIPLPPGFSYTQALCSGVTEPLPLPVPLTINPTQSCTFTVQFDPPTVGPLSGYLQFGDNAGVGESNLTSTVNGSFFTQIVPLSGTGVASAPPSQANLVISKTGPSTVSPGDQVTYTIQVTNSGPDTATTVVVNDVLPSPWVTYDGTFSVTTGCTAQSLPTVGSGGTVSCTLSQDLTAGSSATVTIGVTVAGTVTSGQIISNTATVSEDEVNANSSSSTATTTVSTSGGGGGTPACGCSTTGAYVNPNQGVSPAASSAKYTASTTPSSPAGNPFTLTIKSTAGTTVFNQSLTAGATWGFSPDGDRLEVDSVSGSEETASVYNLASSTLPVSNPRFSIVEPASSSRIVFSPSGQYLAYTGLTGSSFATLQIYNVLTGKKVYENDFSFQTIPGSGADKYGVVGGWGFGPDKPETSFVYAYLTGQTSAQWELVHLERSPLSNTNGSATFVSLTALTSAYWQFSPCGDVIAIVTQPSNVDVQLLRTVDGTSVSDTSLAAASYTLSSTSTEQIATSSSGTQIVLADDSTYNLGCSAQNTPAGSNETVQPTATGTVPPGTLSAPVTLSFPSVGTPGGQISLSVSTTGPLPPADFGFGNPPNYSLYYDLTASPSSLSFSTPITICINYTGTTFSGQPALWHIVNGTLTDITIPTPDTINHIICGSTPSLSPFVIFGAAGPVSTTTALTSSLNSAVVGQAVTLTAQISPGIVGTPTGTVTFFDGQTQLAGTTSNPNPATLVAGTAAYTTSSLSVGVHLLTAVYSGDINFSGSSSSPALVETISVPADFSLSAAPPSLTIQQGQSGTTTITITPVGGYSGTLNLSCPTLPSFASCVFTLGSTAVTSVTLDGSGAAAMVGLTINTTGPNGLLGVSGRPAVWRDLQNMRPGRIPPMLPAAALWLMGILALAARQKNYKKLFGSLLLIVVLAGLGMLTACGFTPVSHATNSSATPTGQSTAVVSVSGSTTHTLNLTVTITAAP